MVFSLQTVTVVCCLLVMVPAYLAVPIKKAFSRKPASISMFSAPAAVATNPWLRSKAFTNGHIASALYGPGAFPYQPMAGVGLGTGLASYTSYGGSVTPYHSGYAPHFPGQVSTSYENYQSNHLGLGHSVTSKKSSYVSNGYGYPSLGGSYQHSTNVYGRTGLGGYVPIGGAKYGQYGSYDPLGYGAHGSYAVTPGFTHFSHTQTVPNNLLRVNKLRGYGR